MIAFLLTTTGAVIAAGAPLLLFWRRRWLAQIVRLERDYERLSDEIWELRAAAEARDRAEAASEAKSRFLATVSHEIRTPLNGIIGTADLLRATGLDGEQQAYVAAMQASGQALVLLIDEILDFSKIEAGRLDLANDPFDLTVLVESVVELLSPRALAKGLEIAALVTRNTPRWVVGDGPRLRQVLTNLTGNAVKFTETGGVGLRVSRDGDLLRFAVSDTGPGVPVDRRTAIFAEFEQADNTTTRLHGGTGLGLAISSRIITHMGSSLTLEDRAGGGSIFSFAVALPAARAVEWQGGERAWPSLRGQQALIFSPSIFQARFLCEELFTAGAQARQVAHGADALAMLQSSRRPPDIVFIDCALGAADVTAIIEAARTCGVGRSILLMSPMERRAFGHAFMDRGDGWLVKPVRSASLAERLAPLPAQQVVAPLVLPRPPSAQGALAHVLLVEDNEINTLIAQRSLERLGAQVTHAADGYTAFDLFEKSIRGEGRPFTLIIMDVSMPGLDGIEVTRRIRAIEGQAKLQRHRIVALTAHAFEQNHRACREAGMDDVLTKPIDPATYRTLIDRPDVLRAAG